jgi:hypothetical protein
VVEREPSHFAYVLLWLCLRLNRAPLPRVVQDLLGAR